MIPFGPTHRSHLRRLLTDESAEQRRQAREFLASIDVHADERVGLWRDVVRDRLLDAEYNYVVSRGDSGGHALALVSDDLAEHVERLQHEEIARWVPPTLIVVPGEDVLDVARARCAADTGRWSVTLREVRFSEGFDAGTGTWMVCGDHGPELYPLAQAVIAHLRRHGVQP